MQRPSDADAERDDAAHGDECRRELVAAGALQHIAGEGRRLAGQVQAVDETRRGDRRVAVGVGAHRDHRRYQRDEEVRREQQREELAVRLAVAPEPAEGDSLAGVCLLTLGPPLGAGRVALRPGERARRAIDDAVAAVGHIEAPRAGGSASGSASIDARGGNAHRLTRRRAR